MQEEGFVVSATADLVGENTRTRIGFSPSLGSIGFHAKAGFFYTDENEVYHYVDLEGGAKVGIGFLAEVDITNEGHGQKSQSSYDRFMESGFGHH